jgi:hypothetical protein
MRSDFGDNSGAIPNGDTTGDTTIFRIIRRQDFYAAVATADDIAHTIEHAEPGRYVVEEVSWVGELHSSGHSCRRWDAAIRHTDGQVALEPEPWPE